MTSYVRAEREAKCSLHKWYHTSSQLGVWTMLDIACTTCGQWNDFLRMYWNGFEMENMYVMRHNPGVWNGIWSDMFIKTTFMRYGKGPGGLVAVTLKPSTIKRWALSLYTTSRVEMRHAQGTREATTHKEEITSLHFTSLHFTSLHFTSLHFTSLHFTKSLATRAWRRHEQQWLTSSGNGRGRCWKPPSMLSPAVLNLCRGRHSIACEGLYVVSTIPLSSGWRCRWRVQDDLVETGVDDQASGGDLGRYIFESAGGLWVFERQCLFCTRTIWC